MDSVFPAEFRVEQAAFSGTLPELLTALRSGRLPPSQLDLLSLVRDWLEHFAELSSLDLDLASAALPRVAQVLELKLRLLLPRQPRSDEDEVAGEIIEAVELLVDMDNAVDYLRSRREDRRLLLGARAAVNRLERPRRPMSVPAGRLAELAGRLRAASYFDIARDGFGFREASSRLLELLRSRRRLRFSEVRAGQDWARVTVLFAALLELVRSGSASAVQGEAYGELIITRTEKGAVASAAAPTQD